MKRVAAALLLTLLGACNSDVQAPLVATHVEITAPRPGSNMSAGYLTLHNNTDQPIAIDTVQSPQFARVEIHETSLENGIARMRRIEQLVVAAHGSVVLERGKRHLMLMQPRDGADTTDVELNLMHGQRTHLTIATSIQESRL